MLCDEVNVGEAARAGQTLDPAFFCALAHQEKNYVRTLLLQLSGGIEQGFEAVRHSHGADVADLKFSPRAKVVF